MVERLKRGRKMGSISLTPRVCCITTLLLRRKKEPNKNITEIVTDLDKSNVNDSSTSIIVENLDQHNANM